jgi:hypothetical protein
LTQPIFGLNMCPNCVLVSRPRDGTHAFFTSKDFQGHLHRALRDDNAILFVLFIGRNLGHPDGRSIGSYEQPVIGIGVAIDRGNQGILSEAPGEILRERKV